MKDDVFIADANGEISLKADFSCFPFSFDLDDTRLNLFFDDPAQRKSLWTE